ncbi:hypothetical protein DCCM_2322 [Desulfocucumis palustris]|uniref:Uncharacterized protein n=1 Tax=Desulfocucumis palustris TaxID=1898651 RepID=A0A2L2XC06_9FIRM|nr:hypothetical protein [Desulfocucumis palustris]GBF33223.1 hypothetical protein DCCM_2322 [Desulfocucumis palustris]
MEYETHEPDIQAGIENEARTECYHPGEQMFGYLTRALHKGVAEGSLRSGLEVEKAALILWACTIGIFVTGERKSQYLIEFHKTKPESFVTAAYDLILRSISKEAD